MAMVKDRRSLPPLDAAALERMALRYVERFATTQGKLADYLTRKVRERGWDGDVAPDPSGIASRMAGHGYVDDRGWAEAKAASLTRRGLGAGRVTQALRQARVGAEDTAAVQADVAAEATASALAFARRRRFGPFASAPADRPQQQKQIAAMVRAGHAFGLARVIVAAEPGDMPQIDTRVHSATCDDSEPC